MTGNLLQFVIPVIVDHVVLMLFVCKIIFVALILNAVFAQRYLLEMDLRILYANLAKN